MKTILKAAAALSAIFIAAGAQAVDVAEGPGVSVEVMGALPLQAEEIGVATGDFRTLRVRLAPGAQATLSSVAGDAAVIFVERGAVQYDAASLHAGRIRSLSGAAEARIANDGQTDAVLLIGDVVGVSAE